MKLSYQWLKELTSGKESPEKVAELLNLHVAAVEELIKLGDGFDKIIVAEILEIKKHPNADKLQLVKLAIKQLNNKTETLEIVCGAFNIKVGDKVPLAMIGAKLPNGMEIRESVIRGVKSSGMLCAEDELGLGKDHSGILILDSSIKIGEKFSKALGLDDSIIDIENVALSHRPDLFSHIGFARELSALVKNNPPSLKLRRTLNFVAKSKISTKLANLKIRVKDSKDCPRYMAVVMDNIKIKPSPNWFQNRLRNLGIRPINNLVDITNYVMLEIGQPLHAFDFEKIVGTRGRDAELSGKGQRQSALSQHQSAFIEVRRAKSGEKLLCLDETERKLANDNLVITDAKKPIALAGVMGGEESGITEKTKTIVIESANFNPVVIRKGSRIFGIRTEANLRFEKGLPLILTEQAITRAIELIEKFANGKVVSKIYDVKDKTTEKLLKTKKIIKLDINKVSDLIGEKIPEKQIIKNLIGLGFIGKKSGKILNVTVPAHRTDIEYPEDIIEEIARIYGYQKINPEPIQAKLEIVSQDKLFKLEKQLRNVLIGLGFDEVYNYSFYGEKTIDFLKLNKENHLEVANPLNPDQRYLRVSLLPKLLENLEKNAPLFGNFKIFEIGKLYKSESSSFGASANKDLSSVALAKEEKFIGGLLLEKNSKMFFEVKGVIENILENFGLNKDEIVYQKSQHQDYQYLDNFTGIVFNQDVIGLMGSLKKGITDKLKISSEVGVFELNLEKIKNLKIGEKLFSKISSYPPVIRDLAFLVSKKVIYADLFKTIRTYNPLIYSVEPFDVFESAKLGKDLRNIAFHLTFQSFERTLKSEEIDKLIADLAKTFEQKFQAKLRTF